MRPSGEYRWWMGLLLAGLFGVYLVGNGRAPLFDRDEPRYAVTSRAMLQSGDWVVPRFLGEVRTAKPPAIYWLQATSMRLFGTGEFAVRLPGALACAATVALLAATLPPLVGRRRAAWACFMLGTSVLVLGVAKVGVIDGVLLLCVAGMQVALLRLVLRRGSSLANAVVLWVAVGLGGMLKGPVILGVLLMTLLAWWASRWMVREDTGSASEGPRPGGPSEQQTSDDGASAAHDPVALNALSLPKAPSQRRGTVSHSPAAALTIARLHVLLGLILVATICGPWIVAISLREPSFIPTALGHDVATRSVSGLEGHGQPPGFHLLALFGTWFPWSVLLPATLVHAWRRRGDATIRFALAACIGPWLMFEIVVTKLPHYLLVIFPMLALLTADWLVTAVRARRRRGVRPPGLPVAAVIYAAVALGFAAAPMLAGVRFWPATAVGVAWAAVLLVTWWRCMLRAGVLAAGCGMGLIVAIGYAGWLDRAPALTVSRRVAAALHEAGAREAAMVHYKEPSLAWYAGELGIKVREEDEEILWTADDFAISTRERLERSGAGREWEPVKVVSARLYNDGLRRSEVVVIRRKLPD